MALVLVLALLMLLRRATGGGYRALRRAVMGPRMPTNWAYGRVD